MKISNHGDKGDARAKCGVDGSSFADVVNSAMSTPEACIIQSATVDSASADLNAESDSDVTATCHQDASYPGDAFARTEVSSAVAANSADKNSSDATKDYDSREVLLHEEIKSNDDPATADLVFETLDAENGSEVVRQHHVDITYLGDKSDHAEVRSAVVVSSADTGPQVEDKYALPEVFILSGIGTDIEVASSATTVFDPGGIGYSAERAVDEETASQKAGHANGTDLKTVCMDRLEVYSDCRPSSEAALAHILHVDLHTTVEKASALVESELIIHFLVKAKRDVFTKRHRPLVSILSTIRELVCIPMLSQVAILNESRSHFRHSEAVMRPRSQGVVMQTQHQVYWTLCVVFAHLPNVEEPLR
ncbi:hypothetical protein PInf_006605 [Phytophthora infestans]|nr:hypothetical protein PInf_006605 [Phytophthora infestans]